MYENVTVEQAISRGNRMVNNPQVFIMLCVMGLSCLLAIQFTLPIWTISLSILGCIILPWLYWSFMITKWRIWAFANVRNVHELKKKAIEGKLIRKDGSFLEKTEIRTSADKEKLKSLESKFDRPDVFTDDCSVPIETIIYYSKRASYIDVYMSLLFFLGSVSLFAMHSNIIGTLLLLIAGFMTYKDYKKSTNKEPQIIINDKGIQTVKTPFQNWADIKNENVITGRIGNSVFCDLVYYYQNGASSEQLSILEYDTSNNQLENLLHIYRLRSEKKNRQQVL